MQKRYYFKMSGQHTTYSTISISLLSIYPERSGASDKIELNTIVVNFGVRCENTLMNTSELQNNDRNS